MKYALLAAVLVFGTAPAASANSYTELAAVARTFDLVQSFLATETSSGRTVTVTYVAPNRWKISRPPMNEMVIGNTLYVQVRGSWRQIPAPPNTGTMTFLMRHPFGGGPVASSVTVLSETSGSLGGVPARIFVFRQHATPNITATLYVGKNDLPIQNVVVVAPGSTTTIRYPRYNDSKLTVP